MKAIILAAGEGTRLRPLTNDRPKCLVELAGKPLLDHQLAVLRSAGVNDIHVVTGYRGEMIDRPGIVRHVNDQYATTNMTTTLFTAAKELTGSQDVIVSYGDIVYEPAVLQSLMDVDAPIGLAVDLEWKRYWSTRMDNPLDDVETLRLRDGNKIIELGKKPQGYNDIEGQYMGLIKIRADHLTRLVDTYDAMDRYALYDGKDFDNMYMTSFLQFLIDSGWDVRAAFVKNGWMEIDAPEDLQVNDPTIWTAEGRNNTALAKD